ncbi:hypothetical protein FRC12_010081 [Ceratobasidium sp. 428]|nr:hypothetical protein FRC12_010081 [Ceratobasidium sp. 428]
MPRLPDNHRHATLASNVHRSGFLKGLKSAAQEYLESKGSLQILSDIDENVMEEYWLFSPTAPTSTYSDADASAVLPSIEKYQKVNESTVLSTAVSSTSEPAALIPFPTGSCHVSASIPSHIKPHLPQSSLSSDINSMSASVSCGYLYLSSVIIHPQLQQKGLGRQMISELQQLSKSNPIQRNLIDGSSSPSSANSLTCLALDVWAGNTRLREWYESQGWRHIATVEETDDSAQRRPLSPVLYTFRPHDSVICSSSSHHV